VSGRLPVDGSGVTQPVSGTFWQATQPVSGTVSVGNFPATQPVRALKDTGRASVALTAEAVAGSTSEGLITLTQSKAGAATSTGTSYPVAAGKTLRLQALLVTFVATTTTANTARIRLRVNTGGAAAANSPVQLSFRVGLPSATFIANEAVTVRLPIPDGFEIPAGAGVGITHQEAAANGTLDVSLLGYEY